MRRLMVAVLVSVIVISTIEAVVGADLPVKAPPVAMVRAVDWTGLYAGGHVGYGWGDKTFTIGAQPPITPFTISGNIAGWLGGLHGGFNYQVGRVVLGIEGQWTWTGIKGTHVGSFAGFTNTFGVDVDWIATLTGRLGYAFDRWLVFASGGAAWAREDYTATLGAFPASFATTATHLGWTVGGGTEYAFDDNWSLRLDYNYMEFSAGHDGTGGPRFGLGVVPVPPPVPPPEFFDTDLKQHMHIVKLGLTYRFNPAQRPLSARD